MKFAVMQWKSAYGGSGSIYGVVDPDKPGKLPNLGKGHWAEFRRVDEHRFPQAAEARKAIEAEGFYLFGGQVEFAEQEGQVPPER